MGSARPDLCLAALYPKINNEEHAIQMLGMSRVNGRKKYYQFLANYARNEDKLSRYNILPDTISYPVKITDKTTGGGKSKKINPNDLENISFNWNINDNITVKNFNLNLFINRLISDTFGKIDIHKNVNNGFATRINITGGSNKYDTVDNFVNLSEYANNRRGEFKYIYDYENDLAEAKRLYDTLFKEYSSFYNDSFRKPDIITSCVLNYFHKFNISCASIYNRILFPNIIYNSSVLRKYISTFASNIQNADIKDESINQILIFLKNMGAQHGKETLEFLNNWRYNISFGERNPNETYSTYNNAEFNNGRYTQLHAVNVNCTPSLINKYFTSLINELSPKCDTDDNIKIIRFVRNNSLISALYNSPFVTEFNHINLINTIIYSILRILKTTSYYDPETDTDYAYNKGLLVEPFAE